MKIRSFFNKHIFEIIVSAIALLLVFSAALVLLDFDMDSYDDEVSVVVFTAIYVTMASAAIILRQGFYRATAKKDKKKTALFDGWLLAWFLPLAVVLVLLPWLTAGVFDDPSSEAGWIGAFFLLVLVMYGVFLLGFLALPFILLPLELLGRGVVKSVITKSDAGVPMIFTGGYIALVTVFVFLGGFAINIDLPGRFAWPYVILALFGVPSNGYVVVDEPLLWLARAVGVLIIAIPLGLWRINKALKQKQLSSTH